MSSSDAADLNPQIAKMADKKYPLHIAFRNIANAARDEDGAVLPWDPTGEKLKSPLAGRLGLLIADINAMANKPDALFLLEAGRPSCGTSWTRMAAQIEEETGLTYIGITYLNASRLPFGKALFVNRQRVAVRHFQQKYVSDTPSIPSGDYFGVDSLHVELSPVEDGRVVVDRKLSCLALHAPMMLASRLKFASWVRKQHSGYHLLFGDCNTFPDDGGPEMLHRITESDVLKDVTPFVERTFFAFPQDVFSVPLARRDEFGPPNVIAHETADSLWIRPSSVLDHCFAPRWFPVSVDVHPITMASDHTMVSMRVIL